VTGPAASPDPDELLAYWFEDATADPSRAERRRHFWFAPDQEVDASITRRFSDLAARAARGELDAWEAEPRSCLALILLLDQLPRSLHRGSAAAFAQDARALEVAARGVSRGHLRSLEPLEQVFFLMPFEHSEEREVQRQCLRHFDGILAGAPEPWLATLENFRSYAVGHAEIVERFGRFPHRNPILGRPSTPAEREYLASGGESFGQKPRR
jgi:uncharacterized protein (DUF924 family)